MSVLGCRGEWGGSSGLEGEAVLVGGGCLLKGVGGGIDGSLLVVVS